MSRIPPRLRHGLVDAACAAIAATRADLWLGPLVAGSGIVLTLHRVRPPTTAAFAPNAGLETTPEALARLLDVISTTGLEIIAIDDVLERMRRPTSRRFVVLTFDDGYRDNLENAAPVLAAKGVPWTMFVVTDYLKGEGCAWWLELESAVSALDTIDIVGNGRGMQMPARTPREKDTAFEILRRALHGSDDAGRSIALERLRASVALDWSGIVENTFARTEEVAAAAGDGLTIGSHTSSHQVLSRCTLAESAREIIESKKEIETMIGRPVKHIAFPHGDAASIGGRESALAASAGYATAWTTDACHLRASDGDAPWALPRVSMNGRHLSDTMFKALLSGAAFPHSAMRRRNNPYRLLEVDKHGEIEWAEPDPRRKSNNVKAI